MYSLTYPLKDAANLVIPMLALESNIQNFVLNIQNITERDEVGETLFTMSKQFWYFFWLVTNPLQATRVVESSAHEQS